VIKPIHILLLHPTENGVMCMTIFESPQGAVPSHICSDMPKEWMETNAPDVSYDGNLL
jgi:hypothetical protein